MLDDYIDYIECLSIALFNANREYFLNINPKNTDERLTHIRDFMEKSTWENMKETDRNDFRSVVRKIMQEYDMNSN